MEYLKGSVMLRVLNQEILGSFLDKLQNRDYQTCALAKAKWIIEASVNDIQFC